jgi:glycine cleavage system H protein
MLHFSEDHEWVLLEEDGTATIGITDFAQQQLGDLVYIELPEVDHEMEQGDTVCVIESVKAASDLIAPISGTVIEVNEELEDEPELVNDAPMSHWILKVKLSDPDQLKQLMNEEEYQNCIDEED